MEHFVVWQINLGFFHQWMQLSHHQKEQITAEKGINVFETIENLNIKKKI